MREIEVKIRTDNLKAVEDKLTALGCELTGPVRQEDAIYTRGDSTKEWEGSKEGQIIMRLRREGGRSEFNMKRPNSNELDNTEYETEVEDPDAIHSILGILGYTPKVEVKKTRRKGKLRDYEICLDDVEELGTFVELEKLTNDNVDPTEIQEELVRVLESLGLSREDQELRGYDTQMYQLRST